MPFLYGLWNSGWTWKQDKAPVSWTWGAAEPLNASQLILFNSEIVMGDCSSKESTLDSILCLFWGRKAFLFSYLGRFWKIPSTYFKPNELSVFYGDQCDVFYKFKPTGNKAFFSVLFTWHHCISIEFMCISKVINAVLPLCAEVRGLYLLFVWLMFLILLTSVWNFHW